MEQNLKTFSIRYMNHRQGTEIEADETGDIDSKENSRHDPTKQLRQKQCKINKKRKINKRSGKRKGRTKAMR